ncbi:uncharacterized protein EAF02_009469 [Botrytis sinoallii]|uniref:uncharacterized protein n=1 Tax=Botrytis sinoallii TaxID=1463999 RepID=UPI00190240F8|nr:uncharacterized protein EAF02_009469 [Botrytis sinoallii]KAF7868733.1 hypothetical protein EAF02_009469 [Botrytis sinoallii]
MESFGEEFTTFNSLLIGCLKQRSFGSFCKTPFQNFDDDFQHHQRAKCIYTASSERTFQEPRLTGVISPHFQSHESSLTPEPLSTKHTSLVHSYR